MQRFVLATCAFTMSGLFAFIHAQAPPSSPRRPVAARNDASPSLPVRRVVLYKNGIGYFEHLGKVRGNESVTVDFSSAQLNDVLKSLTVIDLSGGRIGGISYNSDAPLGQRIGALRLPIGDRASLTQLLDALRGARLEIRIGERVVAGRLLSVERRMHGIGAQAVPRDELTVISDAGEIRVVELSPAASIKLAEPDSADQVGSYLGLLASTRAPDRRRMTIATAGTGDRDLVVGYVTEAPIWKTTYRIVIPPEGGESILQGWAIVDNTTGADWNAVDLALVAGAPQSFIQQISQPQYARRPIVQPSRPVLLTPQTHEGTLVVGAGGVRGTVADSTSSPLPGVTVRVVDSQRRTVGQAMTDASGGYGISGLTPGVYRIEFTLPGFESVATDLRIEGGADASRDAVMRVGSLSETVRVGGEPPGRRAAGGVVGGVTGGIVGGLAAAPPPPGAPQTADPSTMARDIGDLFEYRLSAPISIPRNQSALVPIIRGGVTIERISLWNGRGGARPLRALWLTNSSGLTLDAGGFTVIEDGVFAGEGLTDALKPDEKRLLSYAVDLGVQIESQQGNERRLLTRIVVAHGMLLQHTQQRTRRVYTIRNNNTTPRAVVIEHPVRPEWTLADDARPVETSASAYRFAVPVPGKQTASLAVEEKRAGESKYEIAALTDPQLNVIVGDTGENLAVRQALGPIMAKKAAITIVSADIAQRRAETSQISDDQQRVRANLESLKGTPQQQQLVKRFATQLAQQEDRVEVLRRELGDLERARQEAQLELQGLIERLALEVAVED